MVIVHSMCMDCRHTLACTLGRAVVFLLRSACLALCSRELVWRAWRCQKTEPPTASFAVAPSWSTNSN